MKIVVARDKIRTVVVAWRQAYLRDERRWFDKDKKEIYKALLKLDLEKATEEEVAAVIGNSTWTDIGTCHECGATVRGRGILIGDDQDHEYGADVLCYPCAKKLIALVLGLNCDIFIPA